MLNRLCVPLCRSVMRPASVIQVRAMSERSASTPTKKSEKPFIVKQEEQFNLWLEYLEMARAHQVPIVMKAMVDLEVADIIGSETLSTQEIASRIGGAHTPNVDVLLRCLRLLGTKGLFKESAGPNGTFLWSLTPLGAMSQKGVPGQSSNACFAYHFNEKELWKSWMELPNFMAGKSKGVPFNIANGFSTWEYFSTNLESGHVFNECMSQFSALELPIVLQFVPWADYAGKKVIDVGGSKGAVMAAVKAANPTIDVSVLDLKPVIDDALADNPPKDVNFIAGDMFNPDTIPPCDMIFMKHIVHDWSDEESIKILRSCILQCKKLVIVDAILPNAGEDSPVKMAQAMLDTLMINYGGKERTKDQWNALAASAGLKVESFTLTPAPVANIITMVKA